MRDLLILFIAGGNIIYFMEFIMDRDFHNSLLDKLNILGKFILFIYLIPCILIFTLIFLFALAVIIVIGIINIVVNLLFIRKANWTWVWKN